MKQLIILSLLLTACAESPFFSYRETDETTAPDSGGGSDGGGGSGGDSVANGTGGQGGATVGTGGNTSSGNTGTGGNCDPLSKSEACGGMDCGEQSDGCGAMVSCGMCSGNEYQVCGGHPPDSSGNLVEGTPGYCDYTCAFTPDDSFLNCDLGFAKVMCNAEGNAPPFPGCLPRANDPIPAAAWCCP